LESSCLPRLDGSLGELAAKRSRRSATASSSHASRIVRPPVPGGLTSPGVQRRPRRGWRERLARLHGLSGRGLG
jgi:hypothetical protein